MSRKAEFVCTIIGDAILLCLAYVISWKASAIDLSLTSSHAIIGNFVILLFWLFLFQSSDLYLRRSKIQLMNELFRLLKTLGIGVVIIVGVAFIVNIDFVKARGFIPSYIITLTSLIIWRFFWRGIIGEYIKPQRGKVLIFQNGDRDEQYNHFNVVRKIKIDKYNPSIPQHVLQQNDIDGIVIESNGAHQKDILRIISGFADTKYEIFVSPKLYPLIYQYVLLQRGDDSPFLKVVFHPLSSWDRFLKRIMDSTLSIISLMIFSPILAIISIFIKIDTPGPIIHKQQRVGARGKKFILYKFRSMISDAEKYTGPVWAEQNDKRITRVGKFLRPFRLDELPQLINVLKGDMSFVGPRPERPEFTENLRTKIPLYGLRLTVSPGITGWAQVKHNYDRSLADVKKKLEYDLEYINNMSLRLDLKIFLKTVLTVLKKEGAH